jgi:hypothetical protein
MMVELQPVETCRDKFRDEPEIPLPLKNEGQPKPPLVNYAFVFGIAVIPLIIRRDNSLLFSVAGGKYKFISLIPI